jgi:hypothetical protein
MDVNAKRSIPPLMENIRGKATGMSCLLGVPKCDFSLINELEPGKKNG